jgi:hypothetical protein
MWCANVLTLLLCGIEVVMTHLTGSYRGYFVCNKRLRVIGNTSLPLDQTKTMICTLAVLAMELQGPFVTSKRFVVVSSPLYLVCHRCKVLAMSACASWGLLPLHILHNVKLPDL